MKIKCLKILFLIRNLKIIYLAVFLLFIPVLNAQVDIEAVARLHFQIASQPGQWFEGFESYKSGSYSPYQSHRSGMNRDSAFVVRTSGNEDVIEWSTSAIPANFEGDSAYFLWACGFGNNLGKEWFDRVIDGESTIPFLTKDES